MDDLRAIGWDPAWEIAFKPYADAGFVPGRVAVRHRGSYVVLGADGEENARISGRLRHEAPSQAELPVVGDWVALEERQRGNARIQAVLPRRTKVSRRAAQDADSGSAREQVVAANVDVVFVVGSLADELDAHLLERYLTLAWESGARPVILLTKADLERDPEAIAETVSDIGGEVPVHAVSARSGLGLDAVRSHLAPNLTGALIGPSGVGKSTLVNALVGEELLATGDVRKDGTGRHTTTRRQLVSLPGGGLVVDNPGIRELYLWIADEGIEDAFPDIAELAAQCRFSDCSHESEPGCAVRAALEDGTLARDRWQSYRALQRELEELEERLRRRERSRTRRRRPGAGAS